MVVALLTTAASAVENPFSDVASDSTLAQAVMWAYENDITKGTGDTTFGPDETCNRGQVVTFLWRANGSPDATGEGEFYEDAVNWAVAQGLADNVTPENQSPRSDIVTYLWKNAGAPEIEVTDPDYLACNYPSNDYITGQHGDLWRFYSYMSYKYRETVNSTTLTFYLVPHTDYDSLSEAAAAVDQFQSELSDLVTGFYDSGALKETDSEMVVARYLYNWLCDNTVYGSTNTPDQYSAYMTLQYGEGVCAGYAALYTALCRTAGIECYGAGCTALHNGEGHTINYAKLDGTWCYIDATFGDTGNNYDKYFAMTRSTVDGIYALDYKRE